MKEPLIRLSEIEAELCRRSFLFFIKKFWQVIVPEELVLNWHIEYLADELQKVAIRIKNREASSFDFLINVPPGTSKSTIISQLFPAWCWTIDPTIRFITGSYSIDLATRDALKSRDIIRSAEYQEMFPEIIMKNDRDNKREYENTFTGARYVTAIDAGITGKHAHIILIDDPLNPKKAASEVERASANSWLDGTLSTRKVDKKITITIMVMQRLHEDDCSGHWLTKKNKKLNHICLPAEVSDRVKPPELKNKYVNGLLDPIRLDREALAILKIDLGSYQYAGQIEQQPAPDEGGIFKKIWFTTISLYDFMKIPGAENAVFDTFIDGAYSEDESGDPTGFDSITYLQGKIYVKDSIDLYKSFGNVKREIKSFMLKNGKENSMTCIEPKATGKSIYQELRDEGELNAMELPPPVDDKVTRARGIEPFVEAKRIILIEGNWNDDFIKQVCTFPRAKHDEHVDNLVNAVNRFHYGTGSGKIMGFGSLNVNEVKSFENMTEEEKENYYMNLNDD